VVSVGLLQGDADCAERLALALSVVARPADAGRRRMRGDGLIRLPQILHDQGEVVQRLGSV
jgi:hypothetical protein